MTAGIVEFSSVTTAGNNNNTIFRNKITGVSASERPLNSIYAAGASGSPNSTIMISENEFFDFFNLANDSYGVKMNTPELTSTITTRHTSVGRRRFLTPFKVMRFIPVARPDPVL